MSAGSGGGSGYSDYEPNEPSSVRKWREALTELHKAQAELQRVRRRAFVLGVLGGGLLLWLLGTLVP